MTTDIDAVSVLADLRLFEHFTEDELLALVSACEALPVQPNSLVVSQGVHSESMFILVEGKANALVMGEDGEPHTVAKLGEGSFFGEISLFDRCVRSADIIAQVPCLFLKLSAKSFSKLIDEKPRAACKLCMAITQLAIAESGKASSPLNDSLLIG